MPIFRRDFLGLPLAALALPAALAQAASEAAILTRAIPSTGERLPAVGLGTAAVFDRDDSDTRRRAGDVVRGLVAGGGRLIDTGSTYGDAESVLGAVVLESKLRDQLFLATKAESPDIDEFKRSLARLRVSSVDLMQLHNVRSARQSLAQFRDWKAQGLCRYIGITSTYHQDFAAVEAVLRNERPDFVQIDYSLDNRLAEERILPVAAEMRVAVLTALPLGRARLFRAVRGKAIPDWAQLFADTWAQFFLKFLLADERVTAVIPGTSNAEHMADNLGAMRGRLPNREERERMVTFAATL
ncbi:MAG TPA: aldo/keto reductase [Burkholderiaceae bacterium]|nr:aldo/keto reductase [Burkholderiaceae bacterium]HQR69102.1 aldo/keto reductase [Burkholderiaceae bacterium]